MTARSICLRIALVSTVAYAQVADTSPSFGLADIHASPQVTYPYMRGGVVRGGRFEVRTASMVDLISRAYDVPNDRVLGGPSWLDFDRFDILASAPANTTPETAKLMLKALLADRFKLKVHMDSKPLPAFVLSMGKGKHKLKESDDSQGAGSGCRNAAPPDPQQGVIGFGMISCHSRTTAQMAQDLQNHAPAYTIFPVVDQTGLKGNWDYDLKWTARGQLAAAGGDAVTLFDAVDKQLGLKLELQKIPFPVLVVESVNQNPTDNPPGVVTALPPLPPAEFEVGTIKPTPADVTNSDGRIQRGRVDFRNIPLRQLLLIAWDINTPELLSAPKFVENARFDIAAKAPSSPPGFDVDEQDLRRMLRSFLTERFNIKSHMEERPVEGYVLSGNKPKMPKADASNRTSCKEGPGPDGKDPRLVNPVLGQLFSCQNMTMQQFAALLPRMAGGGYTRVTVLDTTGLTGAYDFTLSFSPSNVLRGIRPGQSATPGSEGAGQDPSGALSLPDAVNKQLGLKLELKKRPMQVLVIDHIDEKPGDN